MKNWMDRTRAKFRHARSGPFVALDIDRRWLRIVHAEPQRAMPLIRKLAAIEVPASLDLNDPQATGQFIGAALRKLKLTGQRVAMDVPRSKALLKTITLPPVDDERELPGMVRYQVEKELPFTMSEAVIDFTVEPHVDASNGGAAAREPSGETVLVAAVRRAVVEHYQKIAESADIDLQQLGLRPYADVHCLRACLGGTGAASANLVLIHLTADEAEINVLLNGSLAFSRSTSMVIAHDEQGRPVADSPVDGLVLEVVRTIQSVRAAQQGTQIGRLWVAGETGHEAAFASSLQKRLGSPCEVLRPIELLRVARTADSAGHDSGYVTALGLAIAHTAHGLPLDFLHPKEPPVERDMVRLRTIYGATAAAAILVLALAVGLFNRQSAASQLAALEAHRNELLETLRPVEILERRIRNIDSWLAEDRLWLDHWANISAALPGAQEAYVTSLKTSGEGIIVFTLKARSSAVITEASRRLREAGYDVKLSSESSGEDEYGYRYSNELRLTPRVQPQVAALTAAPRPADDGSAEMIRQAGGSRGPASSGNGRGER
jgi:Tfp pilus assembly PilM family ATPase